MNIRPNDLIASQHGVGASPASSPNILRGTLSGAMLAMDVATIIALSCIVGIGYHLIVYKNAGDIAAFIEIGAIAACTFSIMSLARGDYAASNVFSIRSNISHVIYLWNLAFAAMLVLAVVTKTAEYYSRGSTLLFYSLTLPVLIGLRLAIAKTVERASRSGLISLRRVFLFGTEKDIVDFQRHSEPDRNGLSVVGSHFIAPDVHSANPQDRQANLQANIDAAVEKVRFLAPDSIVLMLPWSDNELIDACVDRFICLPTEIHLGPDRILRKFLDTKLSRLGGFVSLRLTRAPLSHVQIALKRAFDITFGALALTILMPALLVIAALIKFDSAGPVLFFQLRHGFNRRPFRIVKFRTMVTLDDDRDIRQAKPADPRFTRLGRWLRRLNIDEIPQLFNVVMGDMSLVGPRPHAVAHDETYGKVIATYARRHKVKPGMTGWAQINGMRGETQSQDKMEQRIQCDLYYIENCSLLLDIWILLQTVFSSKAYWNAY